MRCGVEASIPRELLLPLAGGSADVAARAAGAARASTDPEAPGPAFSKMSVIALQSLFRVRRANRAKNSAEGALKLFLCQLIILPCAVSRFSIFAISASALLRRLALLEPSTLPPLPPPQLPPPQQQQQQVEGNAVVVSPTATALADEEWAPVSGRDVNQVSPTPQPSPSPPPLVVANPIEQACDAYRAALARYQTGLCGLWSMIAIGLCRSNMHCFSAMRCGPTESDRSLDGGGGWGGGVAVWLLRQSWTRWLRTCRPMGMCSHQGTTRMGLPTTAGATTIFRIPIAPRNVWRRVLCVSAGMPSPACPHTYCCFICVILGCVRLSIHTERVQETSVDHAIFHLTLGNSGAMAL